MPKALLLAVCGLGFLVVHGALAVAGVDQPLVAALVSLLLLAGAVAAFRRFRTAVESAEDMTASDEQAILTDVLQEASEHGAPLYGATAEVHAVREPPPKPAEEEPLCGCGNRSWWEDLQVAVKPGLQELALDYAGRRFGRVPLPAR